jgi:hypothetical protein
MTQMQRQRVFQLLKVWIPLQLHAWRTIRIAHPSCLALVALAVKRLIAGGAPGFQGLTRE